MTTSHGSRRTLSVLAALLLLGAMLLLVWMRPQPRRSSDAASGASHASARQERPPAPPEVRDSGGAPVLPTTGRQELPVLAPGSGVISGVVSSPAGAPIEGATCRIFPGSAPLGLDTLLADFGEREEDPAAEASTRSDAEGRFRLEAAPGHWRLRVEAPAAIPWEEDHLRPGDFRWVRLEQGVELAVRVVSPTGEPLAGARVELLRNEYAPSHSASGSAETDRTGGAQLRVPSGHWILAVRHADFRPHFEPLEVPPGSARIELELVLSSGIRVFGLVSTIGGAAPPTHTVVRVDSILGFQESVELRCAADGSFSSGHTFSPDQVLEIAALASGFGEVRKELDLGQLAADQHEVELQLALEHREHSVHGRVVDAAQQGIARVSVFVKPLLALPAETETPIPLRLDARAGTEMQHEPQESFEAQWRWAARTDARGKFVVGGMDHRRPYSLLLVSHDHANARLWIEASDSPRGVDLGTVVLHAGGRIHGVVRALDGSPVAGLALHTLWVNRVRLQTGTTFRNRRPDALTEGFETVTTRDGLFSLGPLPAGEFFVMVGSEQFGPFALHAGEDRGPEVLEIGRDPRLDEDATVQISGRVIDVGGTPVDDGFVQVLRETDGASRELVAAASVDGDGAFRLSARPPGPFVFKAIDVADGCLPKEIRFESAGDWRPGDIVLHPNPRGGARLQGRVLGPSGDGLAGMKVTLHVSPALTSCSCVHRTVYTDPSGGFDFGPLAAGGHRLVVVDPGGRLRSQDRFPVDAGSLLEITLEE